MKRTVLVSAAIAVVISMLFAGCAPAAPVKPAEPTKAAAPAAAAQPATSAASTQSTFPEKGKVITINVPYAAGGSTDVSSRLLGMLMERDLGVPVQVVNRAGASSQVGMTEAAASKPDGYTVVAVVLPGGVVPYLDEERKSTYTRKNFQALGNQWYTPSSISVVPDSPYKSVKDLVDAARAKPGTIKIGTTGLTASSGLAYQVFAQATKAQYAPVHFDGGGPLMTAFQGGHIDAAFSSVSDLVPLIKSNRARVLGITDRQENPLVPGVPTFDSQGFPVFLSVYGGLAVPTGTPKEIVSILSSSLKRLVESDEHKKKMDELGQGYKYMTPDEFDKLWIEQEDTIRPLIPLIKLK